MAIASCLVDTNILLRATRRADPQHQVASTSLGRLASQGTLLYYTPQNIAELWNTMTRPVTRNGLGLSTLEADREVRAIEDGMILLPTARRFIASGAESSCSTVCLECRFTMRGLRLR